MTNEKNARVSTREAAELAGVTDRTIKRWAAAGRLSVEYRRMGERAVCATYDAAELRAHVIMRGCGHLGLCLRAWCNPDSESDWSQVRVD